MNIVTYITNNGTGKSVAYQNCSGVAANTTFSAVHIPCIYLTFYIASEIFIKNSVLFTKSFF